MKFIRNIKAHIASSMDHSVHQSWFLVNAADGLSTISFTDQPAQYCAPDMVYPTPENKEEYFG
jgi:hypothetical protein